MTPSPTPSAGDLRDRLLARLEEIRRVLDQAAATVSLSADRGDEYGRLMDALRVLERRVKEILAD